MEWLKRLFGKPTPNLLDRLEGAVAASFRRLGAQRGCPPTPATSDEAILDTYKSVVTSFREAAASRNEQIPATQLNAIVLFMLIAREEFGEDWAREHLRYEVNRYRQHGLREAYRSGISLFNQQP